jgi:hypothetical protein
MPKMKATQASRAELCQLVELMTQRACIWAELGMEAQVVTETNLVPFPNKPCNKCIEQKKEETNSKKHIQAQAGIERHNFKILLGASLLEHPKGNAMSRSSSSSSSGRFLAADTYALVPTVWWKQWLSFVKDSGQRPGSVDTSCLYCKHGKLQYNAANYFRDCDSSDNGMREDIHPHTAVYKLVPLSVGVQIESEYGFGAGKGWPMLTCYKMGESLRNYDCSPEACTECSLSGPSWIFEVKLVDNREGANVQLPSLTITTSQRQQLGVELKGSIVASSGIENITAGQLLLFKREQAIGDCDPLDLAHFTTVEPHFGLFPAITAEIYAFDMSETVSASPAKRQRRSTLLDCNLMGSAGLGVTS